MTTKTRNRLAVLFILAFPFMVALGFLITDLIRPLPPLPPLPDPNGYDVLMKAAQLVPTNPLDYDKMNLAQLREANVANAGALALARAGLSNECRVPVQFSQAYNETHLDDLAGLKSLARAFVTEGKLAEMENHPDAAAKAYLDTVRLGVKSARGGVLIDGLVGIALEGIGTSNLQKLDGQLDAKSCRETVAALETLDAQSSTFAEVMRQENDWSHRAFPGLRNEIARLMTRKSLRAGQAAAGRKYMEQQIRTRQVLMDLAARAYELDQGKKPASAADLVPAYLKSVPQDPFTGTNLIYSPK